MIKFFILSKAIFWVTVVAMIHFKMPLVAQPYFSGYLSTGYATDPGFRPFAREGANATIGAGVFLPVRQKFAFGVELGHHYGTAGSEQEKQFSTDNQENHIYTRNWDYSLSWVTASTRWTVRTENPKPYFIVGIGLYYFRGNWFTQVRNEAGAAVPDSPDITANLSHHGPGLNAGIGLDWGQVVGPVGIGFEIRGHLFSPGDNVFDNDIPGFFTFALVASLR